MSSSNSPCAACKFLRRKCTQECDYAPYFPPDQPQKFANVHKVFGASNVSKLLKELAVNQREDAVNSLAYEAEARLNDPVYGCVGMISMLQHSLRDVMSELYNAKKELVTYIGPQGMMPMLQAQDFMPQQHLGTPSSSSVIQHGAMVPMMGIPTGSSHSGQLVIRDAQQQHQHYQQHQQQQQQMFEAQQLAAAVAAREHQEMLRSFELQQQQQHQHQQQQQQQHQHQHQQQQQQQQQQELLRFHSGFDAPTGTGYNQMSGVAMSPSLALGGFDNAYQIEAHQQQPEHHHHHAAHQQPEQHHHHHHHHAAHPLEVQLFLQSQQGQTPPPPPPTPQQPLPQTQQQQKTGSEEEGKSIDGGPSC